MCVTASSSGFLEALGANTPFLLEPILLDLEGGHYMGLILPESLTCLLGGQRTPNSGGSSGSSSVKNFKGQRLWGGGARVQVRYDAHLPVLYLRDGENLRTLLAGTVLPTLNGQVFCEN